MKHYIRLGAVVPAPPPLDGSLFSIQFRYSEPVTAQDVVRDLVDGLLAANAGQSGAAGAVFEVIYPPSLPRTPLWPSVRNMIATGCILGLLVGIIAAAVFARVRPGPPLSQPS